MTLGELLALAQNADPPKGSAAGTCMVCGSEMTDGLRISDLVSDDFSNHNRLLAGNGVCPPCAYLFSDRFFRKRGWLASASGFTWFSAENKAERLNAILNPPEPPFFIYITRAGKKQSWMTCLHRVATSRERFWLSHEDYDIPIAVDRASAVEYEGLITEVMASPIKATKTELYAGRFNPGTCKRAIEAGKRNLLTTLARHKGNPLWEVCVYVHIADANGAESDKSRGRAEPD